MRNALIIVGLMAVAVAGGSYIFLYGPGGLSNISSSAITAGTPAPVTVQFTPLVSGQKSAVATRVNYLITSADELKKLWKMVDATSTPPAVDFTTHAVIAVFAGEQPTAGYAIAVSKIEDSSARRVSITLTKPGGNCMTGQVLTTPYEIAAVPITALPLTHEDISMTAGCSN